MSGIVQNNILRSSGTIAVSAAGLNWSDTIITGSTATVEAGNGYWINTTSNTCTITLPSSAENGDQIVLIDYARTWGTNKIIIDSNGLNYQGNDDTYTVEYTTDGQSVNIVYSDATKGWLPLEDDVVAEAPVAPPTQKAIMAFGHAGSSIQLTNISNLISSSGVVASDTTGVGTERSDAAAHSYGTDKAIIAFGNSGSVTNLKNLVNNSGVVAADAAGVGTAREVLAACTYGFDKGIFRAGDAGGRTSVSNLVSNSGVVASDTTGVGTATLQLAAAGFGSSGQGIFGFGSIIDGTGDKTAVTNLVSSSGVVASNTTGVGTARSALGACSYGGDKAIFVYGDAAGGSKPNTRNLVSNTGVVAANATGAGTTRRSLAAAGYGGDKGILAFGHTASAITNISNLVSNTGVVASDTTGVGTSRERLAGAGYSISA